MKLAANKRYLLTRPRGGMNDALVQLEKTRRYAQKYGRTLIIDLSRSGLKCSFDQLFTYRADFGCEVMSWSDDLGAEVDAVETVSPAILAQRITTYQLGYDPDTHRFIDKQHGVPIEFDFGTDHPEQLLVYEQAGGGLTALCILRRVAFNAPVAEAVTQRLLPIGNDYDAVHVRHSDYRTDYSKLFLRAKTLFRGRRLLICSDSREVKDAAATYFGDFVEILSVSEIPETGGVALHRSNDIDRDAANIDLLSEIVAMARADRFLFTRLCTENALGFYSVFSGFAMLVEALRADPGVIKALFEHGEPHLVQRLFSRPARSSDSLHLRDRAIRLAARLFEYLWNGPALRKAKGIRKAVRRYPLIQK